MLKTLIVGALIALLTVSAHSASNNDAHLTTIDYSPYYQLTIPTTNLAGAKIFSGAGPVIKFSNSMKLGGWVTTGEEDGVPEGFDLALYPRYVLGLDSTDELPADLQRLFSLRAFGISRDAVIAEEPYRKGTLYSACDYSSCLFFVTHQAQNEHILVLKTEGFSITSIRSFLEADHAE
ncbi:hypothetical protein [Halopseudomonas bauzanensis]|uniref:hypothetical protein n=1 Tax=Halopseudomonas bauzanensis TaxID=653930 RepID=UPI002552BFCC|nr:hypothetical protein [Halopseudomonas bauzanensis]